MPKLNEVEGIDNSPQTIEALTLFLLHLISGREQIGGYIRAPSLVALSF